MELGRPELCPAAFAGHLHRFVATVLVASRQPAPSTPRMPHGTAVVEATVAVASQDQALLRRLLRMLGVPQKAARNLDTLVLRRELSKGPDGVRSKCFVNGSTTSGVLGPLVGPCTRP